MIKVETLCNYRGDVETFLKKLKEILMLHGNTQVVMEVVGEDLNFYIKEPGDL